MVRGLWCLLCAMLLHINYLPLWFHWTTVLRWSCAYVRVLGSCKLPKNATRCNAMVFTIKVLACTTYHAIMLPALQHMQVLHACQQKLCTIRS
jgi:hypothetical protein